MGNFKREMPSHTPGVPKGGKNGKEPGRKQHPRTARDATGINAKDRDPIDPRMPHIPPN